MFARLNEKEVYYVFNLSSVTTVFQNCHCFFFIFGSVATTWNNITYGVMCDVEHNKLTGL